MDALKFKSIFFAVCLLLLSSCQLPYYIKSSYGQLSLLSSRQPIDKVLQDSKLTEEEKKMLRLALKARQFAEQHLHLKSTQNYTSFVQLDRPYVTYVVSAAPKWELKHHQWDYFFVGKMPYKGFFNEEDAKKEEEILKQKNLDTYLRGVSAYSTLGWFNDPILSSMLRYKQHDMVNTVIHETVHATLYIKNSADFNERLATFLGNKGTELFYLKEEGPDSNTYQKIKNEYEDERIFSEFISKKMKEIQNWYQLQNQENEELRQSQFSAITEEFNEKILPKMKTDAFKKFPQVKLNNARLLVYKTYSEDLSDFEKLYQLVGQDYKKFIEECKKLESEKNPEQALKNMIK
jgi:predicted aminopeptidase